MPHWLFSHTLIGLLNKRESLMEKHIRHFTRANPGLIVFIVDQSDQMSLCAEDGRSFAEITAESINRIISEMIFRFWNNCEGFCMGGDYNSWRRMR